MASASRATLRSLLQKEARIGANADTDLLDDFLYEGVKQLQYDMLWLEKSKDYYVREYFSIGTDEGLGIILDTATGTVKAFSPGSGFTDLTGSSFAQLMSTSYASQYDTGVYFSYDTASGKFTATISTATLNSTAIILCPPLYDTTAKYDLCYKMFGIEDGWSCANTVSISEDSPPDLYTEYPLPTDFLYVKEVRFQGKNYPLMPCIYKDRDTGHGVPSHYYIRDNYLGLTPAPNTGGDLFQLNYYYLPADFAADTTLQPFPEIFDYAIIYYAAMLYKQYQSDMNGVLLFKAKYEEAKVKGVQHKGARRGGAINVFERGKYRNKHDPRRYHFG